MLVLFCLGWGRVGGVLCLAVEEPRPAKVQIPIIVMLIFEFNVFCFVFFHFRLGSLVHGYSILESFHL